MPNAGYLQREADAAMPTLTVRLLQNAIRLLGSEEAARGALDASAFDFSAWVAGQSEPPWPTLERLMHLVVDEQERLLERLRRGR